MGAIGTSALGLSHADRFDGMASLGGPLDAAFFQRMLDQFLLAGFCPRETLIDLAKHHPEQLNDPAVINACATPATPMKWEHPNDFNHWHNTINGGTFDRSAYVGMMEDLQLAFGNFFSNNPDSPFSPPGVDPEKVRHPAADFCTHPVHISHAYNAEWNPDGTYDAITFCDGEQQLYFCNSTMEKVDFCAAPANKLTPLKQAAWAGYAATYCAAKGGATAADKSNDAQKLFILKNGGNVDACREQLDPVGVLVAVDYNGNGRRDYGEPVINNGHERYDDVGADGCADAYEDGAGGCRTTATAGAVDPNHDNYDVDQNPTGTENNWQHDPGEPFRDDGLDGVPGTHDDGEGNGTFDLAHGRERLVALDGRTNFKKLTPEARARIHLLGDGGIRDIFNLGLQAMHWFGALKGDRATASYRDFLDIPGMVDRRTGYFSPWNQVWKTLPHDVLMMYGKENPTDADLVAGEGDHVGTPGEAVDRFYVLFNWAAALWPSLEKPVANLGGSTASERQRVEVFQSEKLHAKWEYGIALPPGYDDPANADQRYPVVYMLHGYGMEPSGFLATALITDSFVTDTNVKFRPMIYVFPYGRCCWINSVTGARECRELDDSGADFGNQPNWARECHSGTFWINRVGYTNADATAYGDAFFELMDHVDANYRTLPAADVEAR
jgi:putative hemolysin